MAELIVQSGKHQGKRLRLPADVDILIGRDEDCQIRLASSDVSRHHCAIRQTPEGMVARDLSSRNGTYLNEVLIEEETPLQPGDFLRIGPMVFQVPGAKTDLSASSERAEGEGAAAALSDDDIAAWLSQDALTTTDSGSAGPGDTTIIPTIKTPPEADEPESPAGEPAMRETASTKEPPPRQFRSVAEEAADIIRRHWTMIKAEAEEEAK